MKHPWVQNDTNPGWLASQTYAVDELIEFMGYDPEGERQGRILGVVLDTLKRTSTSLWLAVGILCVEDQALAWWLSKGLGKSLQYEIELHICHGVVKKCRSKGEQGENMFHTDMLRVMEEKDVINRTVKWWTEAPAKVTFEKARKSLIEGKARKEAAKKGGADPEDIFALSPNMEPAEAEEDEPGQVQHGAAFKAFSSKLEQLKKDTEPKKKKNKDKDEPAKAETKAPLKKKAEEEAPTESAGVKKKPKKG